MCKISCLEILFHSCFPFFNVQSWFWRWIPDLSKIWIFKFFLPVVLVSAGRLFCRLRIQDQRRRWFPHQWSHHAWTGSHWMRRTHEEFYPRWIVILANVSWWMIFSDFNEEALFLSEERPADGPRLGHQVRHLQCLWPHSCVHCCRSVSYTHLTLPTKRIV